MKSKSAEMIVEELLTADILNGVYPAGSRLKPERELALSVGYSRPVIHKAIIRLEGRGLVTIIPRQGVAVNDYRTCGKLALLESIYDLFHDGISSHLNLSMLQFIENTLYNMIELVRNGNEHSRLACYQTQYINSLSSENEIFQWMHTYAIYSGNLIYPMVINEFKSGIFNVSAAVFRNGGSLEFCHRLRQINEWLNVKENELKNVHYKQDIRDLFQFIERYWLDGGGKHE